MKKTMIVILFFFCMQTIAQISNLELIEDLEQLRKLIEAKHANPYWLTPKSKFDEIFQNAKKNISSKEFVDEASYIEIFKVISALKDGHSVISSSSRYKLFGYLPFTAKWFDEGLYITKTTEKYKKILGHRITKIDDVDIDVVLNKITSVLPHANESRFNKFVGSYVHLPGLLFGLGLTHNPQKATFDFSNNEKSFKIEIEDLSPDEEKDVKFVSYLDSKNDLPLYQRNNDQYYWFENDVDNKILYFQYNRIGNMDSESSLQFAKRLWSFVDSVEIEKFVLDLRYNGGGSFPYSLKFVQAILDRPSINKPGKLFIITGYNTFSAAILMLNILESKSHAIILGDYPCDHPGSPGDPEFHLLKNSQIKVYISELFHPSIFPNDKRKYTLLDKEIKTSWSNFKNGLDPNMDFILNYSDKGKNSLNSNLFKEKIGKYEYSKTRNIKIKAIDDELWLEISHSLITPIYQNEDNSYCTEIVGLYISFGEKNVILNFPDGTSEIFNKIDDSSISAIDAIYSGDMDLVRDIYRKLKQSDPDFIELIDHQMSFLASIVYFDLLSHPELNASEIAKSILNLGIELNDGAAPFCQFSLKFY